MRSRTIVFTAAILIVMGGSIMAGCSDRIGEAKPGSKRIIVAADSILSTMTASLLPSHLYSVTSILPPWQCPGHYDVKPSDIEQLKKADLVISFKEMAFLDKAIGPDQSRHVVIDTQGRNVMTPDAYLHGLDLLAGRLAEYFPEDRDRIMSRKRDAIREVNECAESLLRTIVEAGLKGKPVLAAAMQKEPLEWMGFSVVGEYGRPESMSVQQITRLVKKGKEDHVIFVADNLQSGPDAGKGIAESLGVPHIVLTNFPSEKGYLKTVIKNVETVRNAARMMRNGPAPRVAP